MHDRAKFIQEQFKNLARHWGPVCWLYSRFKYIHCEIERPGHRATYSGHKRRNAIKIQTITTADVLILHISGPIEARRHDMTLFRTSVIEAYLQRAMLINGEQHYIPND